MPLVEKQKPPLSIYTYYTQDGRESKQPSKVHRGCVISRHVMMIPNPDAPAASAANHADAARLYNHKSKRNAKRILPFVYPNTPSCCSFRQAHRRIADLDAQTRNRRDIKHLEKGISKERNKASSVAFPPRKHILARAIIPSIPAGSDADAAGGLCWLVRSRPDAS